jgi:CBS domain containing-hemolysin-like protein
MNMPADANMYTNLFGVLAVFVLVAANGYFVAAEFSLVAVRRSRVDELVAAGRGNALALQKAVNGLDAYLAATQLGITLSSLSLGWIGEPALANLIEPPLMQLLGAFATIGSHAIAVAIAFAVITILHIVLGELVPKSLALQRTEGTALRIVQPLRLFLFLFWPAIVTLNGLGNRLLRHCGLQQGAGEEFLHSPEELRLLIAASQEAGLLQEGQQILLERVLNIGNNRISTIMTPRPEVDWIDTDDDQEEILRTIRASTHELLLVSKSRRTEPIGMISKSDLLNQVLDGKKLDPASATRELCVVHESAPIVKVLELFKKSPVELATVVDEYGILQGIVTKTDLLEAIAGEFSGIEGEEPDIVARGDGSHLVDGMMSAHDALDRLGLRLRPTDDGFHTIAGFVVSLLGHLPTVGEHVDHAGWRFEVVDMDGRRIDKLLVVRTVVPLPQ